MDCKIIESGNGGDLVFEDGDLVLTSEIYNQSYLAHFGGNKEASSDDNLNDGDFNESYFANGLLLKNNEQLNSSFEKALLNTEISSSGRIKLESSASKDLEYLSEIANTESIVSIPTVDRVQLKDSITQKGIDKFSYIWNEAKDEIIL